MILFPAQDTTSDQTSLNTLSEARNLISSEQRWKRLNLMPICELEVPLSLTNIKIKEILKFTARNNRFVRLEETKSYLKLGHYSRLSLKNLFRCCLGLDPPMPDTQAELKIKINEKTCEKLIKITGLTGNPFPVSSLIQDFAKLIGRERPTAHMKQEPHEHKDQIHSYYEFCKILSSENYNLGHSLNQFIIFYNSHYKNFGSTQEPLNLLKQEIEKTITALFSDYNCGKSSAEKIMLYCRPAVEKYIFFKVGCTISEVYRRNYEDTDKLFRERRDNITGDFFTALNIPSNIVTEFRQSIEQINRLSSYSSPGEKLNCLMGAIADAKSEVLENTRGQSQIDYLIEPTVIAYILLKTSLQTPMAEIKFLQDWDNQSEGNYTLGVVESAIKVVIT